MKERKFTIGFVNILSSEIDHILHHIVYRVQSESRRGNRLACALPLYGHLSMYHIEIIKIEKHMLYRQPYHVLYGTHPQLKSADAAKSAGAAKSIGTAKSAVALKSADASKSAGTAMSAVPQRAPVPRGVRVPATTSTRRFDPLRPNLDMSTARIKLWCARTIGNSSAIFDN